LTDVQDPTRTTLRTEQHEVRIEDKRGHKTPPALEREGYQLFSGFRSAADLLDRQSIVEVYLPELRHIVAEITGADHAFVLPKPVMRSRVPLPGNSTQVAQEGTAGMVHIDYNSVSAPQTALNAAAEVGVAALPEGRLTVFTVWRTLTPPPQDQPLAVCDLRSVSEADLVRSLSKGALGGLDGTTEYLSVRYNKQHRWGFFSDMQPDELLIFKQFDSDAEGPSGCPHAAFLDTQRQDTAVQRRSLEVRVFTVHR
jgi:hypothetical protein